MNYIELSRTLRSPEGIEQLTRLYGRREGVLVHQMARYGALVKLHEDLFRAEDVVVVSAPGRSEIIGNHTDHNSGRVLAAAINLDTLAVVSPSADNKVRVVSEGYDAIAIDLTDVRPRTQEEGTTAGIIRGVADRMQQLGFKIGGFSAVVTSDVLGGSGLSSSAAFEVMICCILDVLYNGGSAVDPVQRAKISQYAENVHFGKPSGLMDQMASSVGGLIGIDFKAEDPVIEPLQFNFQDAGYALVVIGTGGSHDDLTAEYAAIRDEMQQVAAFFGEDVLRKVRPEQFYQAIPALRRELGDRPLLRAMHYFNENDRVPQAIEALRQERVDDFLALINASGRSSWELLQNMYAAAHDQPLCLALALAEKQLEGRGAIRLHGGGFAGTTLNFVPNDQVDAFVRALSLVFGEKSCYVLDVRPVGAVRVF